MESGLLDLDRLLVLVAAGFLLGRVLLEAVVSVDHGAGQVVADLDDHATDGFAGGRLLVGAEAAAETATVHAEGHAVRGRARLDRAGELDLSGRRVDDAQVDGDVRLFMLAADADAVEADPAAGAGRIGVEGRDRGNDDVLGTGHLAELRAGRTRDAAGGSQVLLAGDG